MRLKRSRYLTLPQISASILSNGSGRTAKAAQTFNKRVCVFTVDATIYMLGSAMPSFRVARLRFTRPEAYEYHIVNLN